MIDTDATIAQEQLREFFEEFDKCEPILGEGETADVFPFAVNRFEEQIDSLRCMLLDFCIRQIGVFSPCQTLQDRRLCLQRPDEKEQLVSAFGRRSSDFAEDVDGFAAPFLNFGWLSGATSDGRFAERSGEVNSVLFGQFFPLQALAVAVNRLAVQFQRLQW